MEYSSIVTIIENQGGKLLPGTGYVALTLVFLPWELLVTVVAFQNLTGFDEQLFDSRSLTGHPKNKSNRNC